MSRLVVPARFLVEERRRREAETLRFVETAHQSAVCREFDPLLQRIDPCMSMVFCREPAPLDVVAAGARPGRYNIMREPVDGPRTFMPVVGDNDEFVEPTSRVFDRLRAMDWWDPRVSRARKEREDRLDDARRKREEDERREINEEMYERYLATNRAFVSMDRSNPWSQNVAGKRGVKHPRGEGG